MASHNRVTVGLGARLWGRDLPEALGRGSPGLQREREPCTDASPERAANDSGPCKSEFWEIQATKCPGLCPRS